MSVPVGSTQECDKSMYPGPVIPALITQEAEAGGALQSPGQPGLHNEFKASRNYIHSESLYQKEKKAK